MRRTSKRWLQRNFTIHEYRSFDIDMVNDSFTRVTLDGVACRLQVSRDTRLALQQGCVVRGRVVSIPGITESSPTISTGDWLWRRLQREPAGRDSLVCIDSDTPESHLDDGLFKAFARRNPPGSAIEASVVALHKHSVELVLPEGIRANLPVFHRGKSTIRVPGGRWWLPLPARLEGLVTYYNLEHRTIFLMPFHPVNSPGYCAAAAGYRARFDYLTIPRKDRIEGRPRFDGQK